MWRDVTTVALFLDDNKPTTTATARRTANKLNVYINKQQLCTWISLFCTFLCHLAPLRHEISLLDEPALWSRWTQHKNCRFLFVNLDNDRYGPKENFAKICQIKWNWIRSVKFEIVRIDSQVTLSVCCHPKILLLWQREVRTSPLYWLTIATVYLSEISRISTLMLGHLVANMTLFFFFKKSLPLELIAC